MSGERALPNADHAAAPMALAAARRPAFAFGSTVWPGLAKLAEESGEVVVEIGKLMMTGGNPNHWSGDLRQRLIEELGDQRAAHMFVLAHNFTPDEIHAIGIRAGHKLALFEQWHADPDDAPPLPAREGV
jgi:hypothetical protein